MDSKRVRIVDILEEEEDDLFCGRCNKMNNNDMRKKQFCSGTTRRARSWCRLSSIWPFFRCAGSFRYSLHSNARQQSTSSCNSKEMMAANKPTSTESLKVLSASQLKQNNTDSICPGGSRLGHEFLFNFGLAFGIAFMVNSSKNEIEKLRESVRHTERLVENLKQEASNRGRDLHLSTSCPRAECLTSCGILRHDSDISSSSVITTDSMSVSQHSGMLTGRAQLEAELEAELEILELHLTTCSCSRQGILSHNHVATSNMDGNFSYSGVSMKSCQVAEDKDQTKYPVCPVELEKRLHILLQKRQQDCIEQLEADLKSTEDKLVDRETELSWWKEHVWQVLKEKSESSTLSGDSSTAHVSRGEETSRCLVKSKAHYGAGLIQDQPSESVPLFLTRNQLGIGAESESFIKDLFNMNSPQNKGGNKGQINGPHLQTIACDI